jgi:serine/threonine protein kinase/lipoprotein NlpI
MLPTSDLISKSTNGSSSFRDVSLETAAAASSPSGESLEARLTEEMAEAWKHGKCARAEDFLAAHPELWNQPEAAVDLIYEEICLRREYGQEVGRAEILQRFPQWQSQLEILLDCLQILEIGTTPSYPNVGESVGDFHLVAKLGHGGHGCVFLATQTSLADRPVVIKFTPLLGHEHLCLARLQHTYIMPLFSVLEDPERNSRALCMPYFGGATLDQLLSALAAQPLGRRTGQDLLRALDEAQAAAGVDLPSRDPARQFFARSSYVQAICWIGACLADALKYAHGRGLVHLDVKPSNVLLTADAQPMLLDFHLANRLIEPGGPKPRWLGGTPAYMSPEQRVALAESREQRPISVVVDGRSDLYSLGLLLYEALGGTFPDSRAPKALSHAALRQESFPAADLPRLDRCNPQVGPGLADILAKCLARDPRDRYPDAGALAMDLGRHLNDLPLRGVANRSLKERWQKWRRRRPYALSFLTIIVLILVGSLASGAMVFHYAKHQLEQGEMAWSEGHRQLQDGHYYQAILTLERALSQVENLPGSPELALKLHEELGQAQRAQYARELHSLADRFRHFYGVDFLPPAEIREINDDCQKFWANRHLIMDRLAPESEREFRAHKVTGSEPFLGSEAEQQVRADLCDLAILYTRLRVRHAHGVLSLRTRKKALQVLDEAEELCGPSAVLYYERQRQAEALGLTDIAANAANKLVEFPPRTAWEHYALGRAYLQGQRLEDAARLLRRAVELDSHGLWPRFYQGICLYRLHHYEDAVLAFTACAALAPEVAGCLYNRALAYQEWGKRERALQDYTEALKRDSRLGVAALNRGILYCQAKRYAEAQVDFQRALDDGVDPAEVHYNQALLYLAQEQPAAARAFLKRTLQEQPTHKGALELYQCLQPE